MICQFYSHKKCILMFYSKSFIILAFTFGSMIHFELMFFNPTSFFCMKLASFPSTVFWKPVLSPCNKLTIYVHFCAQNYISYTYMSIIWQYYTLDYGCFVVSFVIRKCESYFVLLFHYCLNLLKFNMTFKISLLISQIHSLGDEGLYSGFSHVYNLFL